MRTWTLKKNLPGGGRVVAPPGLASSHKCQHSTGPLNLMRLRLWGSGVVMAGPCALGNGQSLSRYLQVPLHSHG